MIAGNHPSQTIASTLCPGAAGRSNGSFFAGNCLAVAAWLLGPAFRPRRTAHTLGIAPPSTLAFCHLLRNSLSGKCTVPLKFSPRHLAIDSLPKDVPYPLRTPCPLRRVQVPPQLHSIRRAERNMSTKSLLDGETVGWREGKGHLSRLPANDLVCREAELF
jgi:hypothetical protein